MTEVYTFDRDAMQKIADDHRRLAGMLHNLPAGAGARHPRSLRKARLYNQSTTETVPAYGVVAVTDSRQFQGRWTLVVDKPSTTFYRFYTFNGPQSISPESYGFGQPNEDCRLALYNPADSSPSIGQTWGPKPDEWILHKGYPGVTVVGPDNLADYWALVHDDFPLVSLLGKTTAAISVGSTSNWDIYAGTFGSEIATTFTAPSAYTRIDLDDDIWVKATWLHSGWILEPLECAA